MQRLIVVKLRPWTGSKNYAPGRKIWKQWTILHRYTPCRLSYGHVWFIFTTKSRLIIIDECVIDINKTEIESLVDNRTIFYLI